MSENIRHWHVATPGADDEPMAVFMDTGFDYEVNGLADALNYAADELDRITEYEHESIALHGEAGDYAAAYRTWRNVETWNVLGLNLRNAYTQLTGSHGAVAPLYRMTWDMEGMRHARIQARQHALWLVNNVQTGDTPQGFGIWECSSRCEEITVHGDVPS